MILTNEFLVPAQVGQVWQLLDQMEAIVPCMPGASYLGRDGEDHRVGIRMKVGAISTHFQGTVRFEERDAATHTATIRGSGKDAGGKASASATLVAALTPQDGGTRVTVKTDLAITGRLAQFGGGVLADISSRLIAQFADNLRQMIQARQAAAAPPSPAAAPAPAPAHAPRAQAAAPEPEALDLGRVMLPVVIGFARRYVLVPVAFFVLGWLAGRHF